MVRGGNIKSKGSPPSKVSWKNIPGRKTRQYKGPKAAQAWWCLKTRKMAVMTGVWGAKKMRLKMKAEQEKQWQRTIQDRLGNPGQDA